MEVVLTIPPSEVENIVKASLLTKFNKVNSVESITESQYVGYGMQERLETVYKGVKCTVEDVSHSTYELPLDIRIRSLLSESLGRLSVLIADDNPEVNKDLQLKIIKSSIEMVDKLLKVGKENA